MGKVSPAWMPKDYFKKGTVVTKQEDLKPTWPFEITEKLARWFYTNSVVKITHHWKFTGVDTADYWIECHPDNKGNPKRVDTSFFTYNRYLEFNPDHRCLIQFKKHTGMLQRIEELDKWEKKHKRERRDYERLKKKFED